MDINDKFINRCKDLIKAKEPNAEDIFVVWNCKTLQNCKALLCTTLGNGKYYECTLNGDKNEIYLDMYLKVYNEPHKLESLTN